MPKAIQTDIAPAIKKYTNIPSRVGDGYQFHELGPQGQVIDDPEQFAQMQAQTTKKTGSESILDMNLLDYAEKLKADMGDPYKVNVHTEAMKLLNEQASDIFNEWSGGKFSYQGYIPPDIKKKWGKYKQELLANAEKIVGDDRDDRIQTYERQIADFKSARTIQAAKLTGSKTSAKGTLTENQIIDTLSEMTYIPEDKRNVVNTFFDNLEDDSPEARRKAFRKALDWLDEQDEIEDKDKPEPPPEGYKDTGRTSGGKKVYISPDGTKAWIQQ